MSSVFVSYASEDRDLAYRITLSLRDYGFKVFFDRDQLPAGAAYDKKIHDEVFQSDVFVFLVSKYSLTPGRYSLTELQFARDRWEHPKDHVLPVIAASPGQIDPEVKELNNYLSAATMLRSAGNLAPLVSAKVEDMVRKSTVWARVGGMFSNSFTDVLRFGVGKSLAYANAPLDEILQKDYQEKFGRVSAGELKAELGSRLIMRDPQRFTVRGRFFPSALLSFGWWERMKQVKPQVRNIAWKDRALQNWLYSGFGEWAPSWDVNGWSDEKTFRLIGQIGEYDEADSIPVLIKSARKAQELRNQMQDRLVVNANVRGLLCHDSHLARVDSLEEQDSEFLESMRHVNSTQEYFLILFDDDKDSVEILSEPVDFYSGYIWQVWAPREWVSDNPQQTLFEGAYFVWEHTNFAQREVLNYSLDSRDHKVEYLRKRVRDVLKLSGELALLQHLMPEWRLRADKSYQSVVPEVRSAYFRDLFAKAYARAAA
jgi:hypothetical protein